MEVISSLKTMVDEDFEVEYELLPAYDIRKQKIAEELRDVDEQILILKERIGELNVEIDKLTNHADGFDYTIAVACGLLTGLIDVFFVGEFNFANAKDISHHQINNAIMKYAKKKGYKGERLKGAISFLEEKYPVAQDNIWKGRNIGVAAKNHHLADLAHHPTLLGLAASIIVQMFRLGIFVNKDGEWKFVLIETSPKELLKIWLPIIISGVLNWLVYIAESKYKEKMDEDLPKPIHNLVKILANAPAAIEILKVADNWIGHLYSDMGGAKSTAGGGMGIPGLFVSLLHEISSMPLLKDTELPKVVNDLYVKNKFDMRSEVALLNELGKQAIPVVLGEVMVRTFYFVRHLAKEIKECKSLKEINWHNVVPIGNRTIERMMTISSGTFMAVDLADAAIRSATTSVDASTFFANMILRVNFVGIGRFAIAVGTDAGMGMSKCSNQKEVIRLHSVQIAYTNAKVFLRQTGMWISAEETEKTIEAAYSMMEKAIIFYAEAFNEIANSMQEIRGFMPNVRVKNPSLLKEINDILEWGETDE